MTEIYQEQDFITAKRQKKKIYTVLFITIGLYLAVAMGLWGWYFTLPYKSPTIVKVKTLQSFLAIFYIIFLFIYCGIKVRRIRRYCIMLGHLKTGLTEENAGEFLRFEDEIEVHEGVDYYTMVLSEWYDKKEEFYERKVLIDAEKARPNLNKGDVVSYITQGNILLRYEVVDHIEEDAQ